MRRSRPSCACATRPSSSPSRAAARTTPRLYLASLAGIVAGRVTASLPPSLVTRYGAALGFERAFVVSLSQSGASPDIVRTLEAARAGGAVTAAIVNQPDSPLARAAAHFLPQHAGPEHSVAATKSVIATLAACGPPGRDLAARTRPCWTALARLPERLEAALACDWTAGAGRCWSRRRASTSSAAAPASASPRRPRSSSRRPPACWPRR